MTRFPETRQTLIRRITEQGREADWQQFLSDYWNPICRFAARWGRLTLDDAEDVASLTFLGIIEGQLLARWLSAPHAKLRTLVCSVARNVISNRARVQSGRERILQENRDLLVGTGRVHQDEQAAVPDEVDQLFYAAWAEDFLQICLQAVHQEYLQSGRADYFRVLYGRVCEGMQNAEIAESLQLKITDVENYSRRSRDRLREQMQQTLTVQVSRYCPPEQCAAETAWEWDKLGEYLQSSGGLERALRDSYDYADELARRAKSSQTTILKRISEKQLR